MTNANTLRAPQTLGYRWPRKVRRWEKALELIGSEIEAIYPSIAIPAYNLEKSFDPFNSTASESKTPAQKIGVWAWKLKSEMRSIQKVFTPNIYKKGNITNTQGNHSNSFIGLYNTKGTFGIRMLITWGIGMSITNHTKS